MQWLSGDADGSSVKAVRELKGNTISGETVCSDLTGGEGEEDGGKSIARAECVLSGHRAHGTVSGCVQRGGRRLQSLSFFGKRSEKEWQGVKPRPCLLPAASSLSVRPSVRLDLLLQHAA